MSMSEKFTESQRDEYEKKAIGCMMQVMFERDTLEICGLAKEILEVDNQTDLTVGPVELTNLSIAVARINTFILRHTKKVAA